MISHTGLRLSLGKKTTLWFMFIKARRNLVCEVTMRLVSLAQKYHWTETGWLYPDKKMCWQDYTDNPNGSSSLTFGFIAKIKQQVIYCESTSTCFSFFSDSKLWSKRRIGVCENIFLLKDKHTRWGKLPLWRLYLKLAFCEQTKSNFSSSSVFYSIL